MYKFTLISVPDFFDHGFGTTPGLTFFCSILTASGIFARLFTDMQTLDTAFLPLAKSFNAGRGGAADLKQRLGKS